MNVNAREASRAVFALSYVNDPIAVPYLGRVLKESIAGQYDAISGLVRVGNPEAVKILKSFSETADAEMKLQVENALQEIRSRSKR